MPVPTASFEPGTASSAAADKAELSPGLASRLRAAAIMLSAGLALHWLCYLPSGSHLGGAIHSYVATATPYLLTLAMITALAGLVFSGRQAGRNVQSTAARAGRYLLALLAQFVAQELLEILIAGPGHFAADTSLGSCWLVLPLSVLLGLGAALATRGLDRLADYVAAPLIRRQLSPPPTAKPAGLSSRRVTTAAALAFGFTRRPPPLRLSV